MNPETQVLLRSIQRRLKQADAQLERLLGPDQGHRTGMRRIIEEAIRQRGPLPLPEIRAVLDAQKVPYSPRGLTSSLCRSFRYVKSSNPPVWALRED